MRIILIALLLWTTPSWAKAAEEEIIDLPVGSWLCNKKSQLIAWIDNVEKSTISNAPIPEGCGYLSEPIYFVTITSEGRYPPDSHESVEIIRIMISTLSGRIGIQYGMRKFILDT